MATYNEAEQARLSLKMTLSNYHWFQSAAVITDDLGYGVMIFVNGLNDQIRKVIPNVLKDCSVQVQNAK